MTLVRAAGAVVWRPTTDGVEVLLVHRPRYDDWSLPKGKLEPGESWNEGASREVEEETGCTGTLGEKVAIVRYEDQHGRDKEVHFFELSGPTGDFVPTDEVDEVAWLDVDAACIRATRRSDAEVIRTWAEGRAA